MKSYAEQRAEAAKRWYNEHKQYHQVCAKVRYAVNRDLKHYKGLTKNQLHAERSRLTEHYREHFNVDGLRPTTLQRKRRNGVSALLSGTRQRARREGVVFSITRNDFAEPLPTMCPVLNIPIYYNNTAPNGNQKASLDRIDPSKGYVPGNVCIISLKANRLKQDNTVETLLKLLKYMKRGH